MFSIKICRQAQKYSLHVVNTPLIRQPICVLVMCASVLLVNTTCNYTMDVVWMNTYHSYVTVNIEDALVWALFIKFGQNQFLNTEHNPILASDPNCCAVRRKNKNQQIETLGLFSIMWLYCIENIQTGKDHIPAVFYCLHGIFHLEYPSIRWKGGGRQVILEREIYVLYFDDHCCWYNIHVSLTGTARLQTFTSISPILIGVTFHSNG